MLGGGRPADEELPVALADLVTTYRAELADLCATRTTQTNGPPGVLVVGLLTVVTWRDGRAAVEVLARTGPHGQWLDWDPARYAYRPAL